MTVAKILAALGLLLVPGCVGDDGGLHPLVQGLIDVALPAGGGGVLGTLVAGRSLKKGSSRSQPQIDHLVCDVSELRAECAGFERALQVEREERRIAQSEVSALRASLERSRQIEGRSP
jgi:outer membrane murein-binding lipoprotein Lpp